LPFVGPLYNHQEIPLSPFSLLDFSHYQSNCLFSSRVTIFCKNKGLLFSRTIKSKMITYYSRPSMASRSFQFYVFLFLPNHTRLFFPFWYGGLNSGLHACQKGTIPLEPWS
jgi:hypothetical protein